MTSPLIISLNLEEDIILPNDSNKMLRIRILLENNEDDDLQWCKQGKREIMLYDSTLINRFTEEILIFTNLEYEGKYNDLEIVESFHSEDIEFI